METWPYDHTLQFRLCAGSAQHVHVNVDMACAQVCTQVVEFLRLQVFLALPSSLSHSNLSNKAGRGAASSPVHSPVFGFMKEKGGYSASTVHVHSDDSDNWVPRRPWQGMLCKHVLAHSGKQNRVHSC
eukprot:scaffold78748_cov16-Tisochrysis_lutea.AAC.1